MKKILFIAFALSLGMMSCKKDNLAPVLTITAPTESQSVKTGTDLKITGKLTDDSLHELTVKITQTADGKELFSTSPTVHDFTTYDINETWKPTVTVDTDMTLTVTAIDHKDNTVTKTVKFKVTK